jgi:hypothetical protein
MDFTLGSGAKLTVSQAPFVDAMALHKALLSSVKGVKLSEDIFKMDVSVLKDVVVEAATSPAVEQAVFKCGARALYGPDMLSVSPALFDDPKIGTQAREDFYEIAWKIVEVNCSPFFKNAFSRLKAAFPQKEPTASPKS